MAAPLGTLGVLAVFAAGAFPMDRPAAVAGAALVAAALRATRRVSTRGAILLLALFGLGATRAAAEVTSAREGYARALEATTPPLRCALVGRVVRSPTVRSGAASAVLRPIRARCEGDRALPVAALVRLREVPERSGRGDLLVATAKLSPPRLFRNQGTGEAWARIARTGVTLSGTAEVAFVAARGRGPGALVDRARAHVRERIEATYHPRAAPLGRALVLGEGDLDPADDEAFRRSGLSHLLAVSGTHLCVAALAVAAALRALFARVEAITSRVDPERPASAIALVLALGYADFAGGAGSVLRAVAMLGAILVARVAGRRPDGARALALALGIGCAADPLAIVDVSFALSAAATAGLLFLAPGLAAAVGAGPGGRRSPPAAAVLRAVATTLAATAACAPVIAGLSRELPALGLAANLVAAPIGELAALPICLLHAVSAPAPALEQGTATVGSGALLAVLAVARAATATGLALPVPPPTAAQLAALAGIVALLATAVRGRAIVVVSGAIALGALELVAHRAGVPLGQLRVSALDVGQGDALLVDLPDGSLMLVDGGGLPRGGPDTGERVLLPALAARRRSRIDVLVLTHPHADHAGGLPAVVRGLEIGEVWASGLLEPGGGGAVEALRAEVERRRIPVREPSALCGVHALGGATVEVLSPCDVDASARRANDASLVLRVSLGRRSILLTGDAEASSERALVERWGGLLASDVLKVGHHGSRTSTTTPFARAVAPLVAITSVGARNGFGHPHAEATARLAGALHARTDLDGEIRFWTDGQQAKLAWPAR